MIRNSRWWKNLFKNWLWQSSGEKFSYRFLLVNRFWHRWPVVVTWCQSEHLYHLRDSFGESIRFVRQRRVKLYRTGVKSRLMEVGNDYSIEHCSLSDDDLVVDVGANIGEFTLYVQSKCNVSVLAIEPSRLEYECLIKNLDSGTATTVNVLLWSESTELDFYDANDTGDSSIFEPAEFEGVTAVTARKLDDVVRENGFGGRRIKLLKVEAEGAEPEILEGAGDTLNLTEYVAVDAGPERGVDKENTVAHVTNRLVDLGFQLLDMNDRRLTMLFKRRPGQEVS